MQKNNKAQILSIPKIIKEYYKKIYYNYISNKAKYSEKFDKAWNKVVCPALKQAQFKYNQNCLAKNQKTVPDWS